MYRFRLIPGDLCESTSESERLLKQVEKVCTGHEKDAGFYPENRRGGGVSHIYLFCSVNIDLRFGVHSLCSRALDGRCLEHLSLLSLPWQQQLSPSTAGCDVREIN